MIFTLCCLFLLFHLLIIATQEHRASSSDCREAFGRARFPPTLAARSARVSRRDEMRDDIWPPETDQGQHFFALFCVEHECNDNKLCCGSHVENCFSTLVRSFRFISPRKPKITAKTIHHFPPQSARRVT